MSEDTPNDTPADLTAALLPGLLTPVRHQSADGGRTRKTLWRLHDGALVESVGSGVQGIERGDKVTAMPQIVCGRCPPCLRGDEHICDALRVQDG